jgi:transposase
MLGSLDHSARASAVLPCYRRIGVFKFPLDFFIVLDLIDYDMISSIQHQSWLFFLPLAQQASLLKDDLLDTVDPLLDDSQLVERVGQRLAGRCPKSNRTGRPSIAPDRLLRCCVLKHLKGWSFRGLERELRSNLTYRRFTHYDAEATPDFSTFSHLFALLDPPLTEKIHQRVVEIAGEQGVARGRKLRVDPPSILRHCALPRYISENIDC